MRNNATDGALAVRAESSQAAVELLVALRALGIASPADYHARLAVADAGAQGASTLAGLLPHAKWLLKLLALQVKHGRFEMGDP